MQIVKAKQVEIEGAILVTHDASGAVTVVQHGDHLGRKGLGWGAGAGLVVGLFAPPLLASVVVGGVAGGLMRPAWSARASWAACSSTPSRPRPRWSWSAMTGSWRRSMPAAASAPSGSASAPAELTENRRQHQAWEREALELVRSGLVEEAVAAYQAHDRVVAADSKPAATLAVLPGLVDRLPARRARP